MLNNVRGFFRYLFDRSEIKKGDKFILDDGVTKNPFIKQNYIVEVKDFKDNYVNYYLSDYFPNESKHHRWFRAVYKRYKEK